MIRFFSSLSAGFWLLSGLILCLGLAPAAVAQAQIEDAADYWGLVDESITLLEQDEVSAAELDSLAKRWSAVQAFEFDGVELPIQPQIIVERLANGDRSADELDSYLGMFLALKNSRETWPKFTAAESALTVQEANSALDSLLADNRYQYEAETENWIEARWRQFNDRVNGWFNEWFADDGIRGETNNPFNPDRNTDPALGLIGVIAAAILAYILFRLIQGVSLGLVREPTRLKNEDDEFAQPLTAKEAMQQAETTAESGDYRRSVRYLYLSTLLVLEEKGMINYDRSLTNREYIDNAKRYPRVVPLLKEVVDVFDQVWYGSAQIDQPTLKEYQERIQALQDAKVDADETEQVDNDG
ncbi:MAG: DUF4129 domain-containing protein [Anaerolineae bacterium]